MAVKVVGKRIIHYRTTCTDDDCNAILEFTSEDIGNKRISCMGRDAGTKRGISCPLCNQIMTPDEFEKIDEPTPEEGAN